jgi:chromosome segregation ATPase
MVPEEEKIRVSARITKDLDAKIRRYYPSMAPAIIEGLELLTGIKEGKQVPNGTTDGANELEVKIGALEAQLGTMSKLIDGNEREIEFLKGQITIKDQQIEKQAFSLQSVIQENSRLNLKLLPESQETKNTQEQKLTRWQYLKGFVFGSQ